MEYCAQYLWEKGTEKEYNPISLVLQQVRLYGKPVLLACICEGTAPGKNAVRESGFFTERLVEWFHNEFLKKYAGKEGQEEIGWALEKELEKILRELSAADGMKQTELHYMGILLKENMFWLFYTEQSRLFLLNKRFNHKQIRALAKETERGRMQGRMQRGIGILLCTPSFTEKLTEEEMVEVLFAEKNCTDEKLGRRLKEIWQESERRNMKESAGAVYIRIQ